MIYSHGDGKIIANIMQVQVVATQPPADEISLEQISHLEEECEKCNRVFDEIFRDFDQTRQFDAKKVAKVREDLGTDIEYLKSHYQTIQKQSEKLSSSEIHPGSFTPATNIVGIFIGCASTTLYGICNNKPKDSYLIAATVLNAISCLAGVASIVYERQKNKTSFEHAKQIALLDQKKIRLLNLTQEAQSIFNSATFFSELYKVLSHDENGSAERCLIHFNYVALPQQGEDARYSRIVSLCIEHLPDSHPLKKNNSQSDLQKEASLRLSLNEPFSEQDGSPKFQGSFSAIGDVNKMLSQDYGIRRPITFLGMSGPNRREEGSPA